MIRLQVSYCSDECQKVHWAVGGHKKQCKPLQNDVNPIV
jgi:hypothetical protein